MIQNGFQKPNAPGIGNAFWVRSRVHARSKHLAENLPELAIAVTIQDPLGDFKKPFDGPRITKRRDRVSGLGGLPKRRFLFSRPGDLKDIHEPPHHGADIIRRRDATYPNIATRIEALRKQRHKEASSADTPSMPNTEAFSSGFRYEILEEVGRGGMGIVFKARDRRLDRVVALKRLPDNLRNHPKAVELFLREARAAASLNHPNVVTVHDAGQEGESFYITMELLEGLPLQQILKRNGRIGPRDVARLGVQVVKGLHYAHEQRIVHRDIKTGNIFFTKSNTIKIMDFGLAKMLEEVRRASTVVGGTPYYMAPEQSLGEAVDPRADLYALGVTFFELLTG